MPKYSLFIQRFPYGGVEASECVSWLMRVYHQAKLDPRFDRVACDWLNDTPITMTRNKALLNAKQQGFDFLLMVDSDMAPDHELLRGDGTQRPFFDVAVEALLRSPRPAVIAAPYVGPPPLENIYVFRWANRGNTLHPDAKNARLDQFTREEAALLAGVQEVGALPTGLMMLDLRCLDKLPQPWTYYEFKRSGPTECDACHQKHRGPEDEKASTEDVTFTRDLGLIGVPILCAWSSWAGHVKRYVGGKPRPYTTDVVAHKMRDAIVRNVLAGEEQVVVEAPEWLTDDPAPADHAGWAEFTGHRPDEPARPLDQTAQVIERVIYQQPRVASPAGFEELGPNGYANHGVAAPSAGQPAPPGEFIPAAARVAEVVFDGVPTTQAPAAGRPWLDFMPPADPSPQPPPPAPVPLTLAELVSGVPLG